MDGHHVQHGDTDVVVGAELLGDVGRLLGLPGVHQVLVDVALHGERVTRPDHVSLQAARPYVASDPCVQVTGRRPEELDVGAVVLGFEL